MLFMRTVSCSAGRLLRSQRCVAVKAWRFSVALEILEGVACAVALFAIGQTLLLCRMHATDRMVHLESWSLLLALR